MQGAEITLSRQRLSLVGASMALGRRGRLSRDDGVVVNLMHFDAARRGDG